MEWKKYPSSKPNEGDTVLVCVQWKREKVKSQMHFMVAVYVKAVYQKKRRGAFVPEIRFCNGEREMTRITNVTHWCYIESAKTVIQPPEPGMMHIVRVVTQSRKTN